MRIVDGCRLNNFWETVDAFWRARFISAAISFLGLALVSEVSLEAQPAPKLDSVSPIWFQRGTTHEVVLRGEALDSATNFYFGGTGIQSLPLEKTPTRLILEGAAGGLLSTPIESTKQATHRWVIAPDAVLGSREIRVAGPRGISNPVRIQISDLPEVSERTPDDQLSSAPTYELPTAISGAIGAPAESDFFRFHLKAGEPVIFDVQANRTGSPLDPSMYLLDSSGKELVRSEDVHGLDPFLEFMPKAEGDYILRLTDTRFQGGGDFTYRMIVGHLPYLDSLFPFGGRRGRSATVQFRGHNLEGSETLNLHIAADASIGRQEIRAHTPNGYSNPLMFEVDDLPEFVEAEPNNEAGQANRVTPPIAIHGHLGEPKDKDVFRIQSTQDQRLVAEVEARSFGSPLDAFLTLLDAQGNVISRNDDANGPDARIEFDAKKDTEYLLMLRDLTDRGGDRFGYRLVVRSPDQKPDFTVRARGGRFRVGQSGQVAIRCEVDRRNGFDGLVRITGDGLPPGVTANVLTLGNAPNFGWLVLSAGAEAVLGNHRIQLSAVGESGGTAVVHTVQFSEEGWLTVLPPAPFCVDVAQSTLLMEQNAQLKLDVSVVRRPGFDGPVRVRAEGLDGVDIPPITIGSGQAHGQLTFHTAYTAPVGVRPLMVVADASRENMEWVDYAPQPVPLTVQGIAMYLTAMLPGSPFFRTDGVRLSAVALPTHSASAANATEFVVKVDRRGLNEEISLSIEGLPKGVLATVNPIAANAREATIKLLVTDQAETGKEFTFTVVGSATHEDRIWHQRTQNITLTVAAPEKPIAAAAAPNEAASSPTASGK